MSIQVRYEDITEGSSYRFEGTYALREPWLTPPRVGDHILDANEFQYLVTKVLWYSPDEVLVYLKRDITQ